MEVKLSCVYNFRSNELTEICDMEINEHHEIALKP